MNTLKHYSAPQPNFEPTFEAAIHPQYEAAVEPFAKASTANTVKSPGLLSDKFGMLMSGGCVVHCLFLPLLIPFIPVLQFAASELLHVFLLAPLFLLTLFSFKRGYRLHKQAIIPLLGIIGLSLLIGALYLESTHELALHSLATQVPGSPAHAHGTHSHGVPLGNLLTVLGSIVLIYAHAKNVGFCRCYESKQSTCACS